jgi:rhodanese-related sulfurtransferase
MLRPALALCLACTLTLLASACSLQDDERQTAARAANSGASFSSSAQPSSAFDRGAGTGSSALDSALPPAEGGYAPYPEDAAISAEELHGLLTADATEDGTPPLVIDMRSYAEYYVSRISGSLSVPLAQLASRLYQIPRERQLVLVCASPEEAVEVWARLAEQGYDLGLLRIVSDNLAGWVAAGFATEMTTPAGCG